MRVVDYVGVYMYVLSVFIKWRSDVESASSQRIVPPHRRQGA
jgi:hypothetical protein